MLRMNKQSPASWAYAVGFVERATLSVDSDTTSVDRRRGTGGDSPHRIVEITHLHWWCRHCRAVEQCEQILWDARWTGDDRVRLRIDRVDHHPELFKRAHRACGEIRTTLFGPEHECEENAGEERHGPTAHLVDRPHDRNLQRNREQEKESADHPKRAVSTFRFHRVTSSGRPSPFGNRTWKRPMSSLTMMPICPPPSPDVSVAIAPGVQSTQSRESAP